MENVESRRHRTDSLEEENDASQSRFRQSEHRDIAHPITAEFRETLQKVVLEAYEKEKMKSGVKSFPDRDES